MEFISIKEASLLWNLDISQIGKLIRGGKITRATKISGHWAIPKGTPKPLDGRTREGKAKKQNESDNFRYPIFEHKDISSFYPPLSAEELIIKRVSEAFYACNFKETDEILGELPETANNRYIRIYALRVGCALDIFLCNTDRFFERYCKLYAELQNDFPFKTEMAECIHELNATLGENDYYANKIRIVPRYEYHDSFIPHLTSLNAVSLAFANKIPTLAQIRAHEMNCIFLEKSGSLVDLQSMHIYLGCAYAFIKMFDEMSYHFEKALIIAEKYDLFYVPALQYYYMRKPFKPALHNFSGSFIKKLTRISDDIHNRYLAFTQKASMNTIYRLLPRDDYILLYSAIIGYSNKEIANIMHISSSTVGKHYSNIYSILGVKNKQEMLELYYSMIHEDVKPNPSQNC